MAHIRKLKVKDIYEITGRGSVWIIDLDENSISPYRNKWKDDGIELRNGGGYVMCEERFSDAIFQIQGIEAYATGEGFIHKQIGLLVKKLDTVNPNINVHKN